MANTKSDSRRAGHLTTLGLTVIQGIALSNSDLERKQRGAALTLTGIALASKSINDLRVLQGFRSDDA